MKEGFPKSYGDIQLFKKVYIKFGIEQLSILIGRGGSKNEII